MVECPNCRTEYFIQPRNEETQDEEIIEEYNRFFKGQAKIEVTKDRIEFTVGTRVLAIAMPNIISYRNDPSPL